MAGKYNDAEYSGNFDHLIGAVETLGNSDAAAQWGLGSMGDVMGPDQLPVHTPCLAAFRILKTCMRTSRTGMKPCLHQLKDLEQCSAMYFHEINKKLPKESCSADKEAYFSIDIDGPRTLKEAKHAWQKLYMCSKSVEEQLNRAATIKTPRL